MREILEGHYLIDTTTLLQELRRGVEGALNLSYPVSRAPTHTCFWFIGIVSIEKSII